MKLLTQKALFVLEVLISGLFIVLHTLHTRVKEKYEILNDAMIENTIEMLVYFIPVAVLGAIISHIMSSRSFDDFIRKYIFSIIIFVPMLITLGDIEFTYFLAIVHLFSSILSLLDVKPKKYSTLKPRKRLSNIPNINIWDKLKARPAQMVFVTFAGLILFGSLFLALPISAEDGKTIKFLDAFFMATSATCVTGLSTISVVDSFSLIGELMILFLIQVGGLGIMTMATSVMLLLGRAVTVKQQVMMQDVLDVSTFEDLMGMIVDIVRYTLVIELFGAIILTLGFSFEGYEFGEALYYGFFHSISAFCNAGFALFSNSLESFPTSPLIQGTVSVLIVLGGLGFIVLKELREIIFGARRLVNLSIHTKIVLVTNGFIILFGAFYIFFSEYLNGLDSFNVWGQVQVSLFQSITTRTAGFNTIPMNDLYPHTLYLMCLIMFIGASPGSTGGGIKTTTFAILFQSVKGTLSGRNKVEFFKRTVPESLVVRSIAIIVISLIVVSFFILLMMRIEPDHSFLSLFFEVVSAFSTVGLSLGITPYLSPVGKLAIIILMFIGRVGPLTLAFTVGQKGNDTSGVEYPEGRMMIG
jgi:trk system potassium uptake protein TrkH